MGLLDLIFRAVDASYVPLSSFTSERGSFAAGNRFEDRDNWRNKPRYGEVVATRTVYRRDGDHYDKVLYRPVDSLRGCNCGRPGCPG